MFPTTKILLRALLPCGTKIDDLHRLNNTKVNLLISKFENNKNIYYIDNSEEFLNSNGTINKELMPDALHLSYKGYEVLSKCLTPTIEKLMES